MADAKTKQKNSVLDAILNQYESNKAKPKKVVDMTKYFSTYIGKAASGKKKFRILPAAPGESPFVEAWFHNAQGADGWSKNFCPEHNDGSPCPFCEIADELRKSGSKEDKELAKTYTAKKFYIVKGIERGKEEEGVKFWRFAHNYKGTGIFDKLIAVFSEKGDITDAKEGRDVIINVNKDDRGNSVVSSILHDDKEPLHADEKIANEWVNDTMVWRDVYSIRDYKFLSALAKGENPYGNSEKTDLENKQVDDEDTIEEGKPF